MKKLQLNFTLPDGICDTHHHVFNPAVYPATPMKGFDWEQNKTPHTAEDYIDLMQKTGITRNVLQACTCYGYDRRSDLEAMQKIGRNRTRMISLIHAGESDETLQDLHDLGVRGVRMLAGNPETIEDAVALAPRMKELGWSVDVCCFSGQQFLEILDIINKLDCHVVIAHEAMIRDDKDPALAVLIRLLKEHKVWVKLSSLCRNSKEELFADSIRVGHKLIEADTDQLLWGTDWPYNFTDFSADIDMEETGYGNDTGTLIKLLPEQIWDESIRKKILVTNPEKLYGF